MSCKTIIINVFILALIILGIYKLHNSFPVYEKTESPAAQENADKTDADIIKKSGDRATDKQRSVRSPAAKKQKKSKAAARTGSYRSAGKNRLSKAHADDQIPELDSEAARIEYLKLNKQLHKKTLRAKAPKLPDYVPYED